MFKPKFDIRMILALIFDNRYCISQLHQLFIEYQNLQGVRENHYQEIEV